MYWDDEDFDLIVDGKLNENFLKEKLSVLDSPRGLLILCGILDSLQLLTPNSI
jgi:hypothetical protein